MAGDWIKFEKDTLDKPEIVQMADLLGTSEDDVIGKLLRVWSWFDSQSRDGNAGSVTGVTLHKKIDRLVSSQGFAACMKKVGWLTDQGMPHFDRHNGESAKKRALTNERAQRFRNAKVTQTVTLNALPEKRREEVKQAPPDGGPVWQESLTILTEQGQSEKTARSFLGMLCREYEEAEIVEAVKACIGKANATAYIRGVLKSRPKKGEGQRIAI